VATTIYLESDDEITAAVARIRSLKEPEAIVVISRASRIGTSRINFKLLAREAHTHGINLVAVSDEPTVRALAVSAGLPAYDTVAGAHDALDQFRRQDEQLARHAGRPPGAPRPRQAAPPTNSSAGAVSPPLNDRPPSDAGRGRQRRSDERPADGPRRDERPAEVRRRDERRSAPATERTQVMPIASAAADGDQPLPEERERRRPRRRRVPVIPLLMAALLLAIVGGGLYAAYLYLPTATITLRPLAQPLGPLEVRVTADPSVAVVDAEAGAIPAERLQLQLSVGGEFPATGVEVTRTVATGNVRFQSENTLFDVPIPAGTVVATDEEIEFETTETVTVPRASFQTGPTRVTAAVRARVEGPRGNVGAGAISQLPADLAAALISVTNPRATSGGSRAEVAVVTQEDYDLAVNQLSERLTTDLDAQLAHPSTTPRGLTLFPTTARISQPRPSPPADAVVDVEGESFTLELVADATVLAVNEALVEQLAADRLRGSVEPGAAIVGEGISVERGAGLPLGTTVLYRATAQARVYREPDRQALLEQVRGRTVSEAQAILDEHGSAEITIWPDVVDRVPEQVARISLTILPPQESP
jgi:hypothetical protein